MNKNVHNQLLQRPLCLEGCSDVDECDLEIKPFKRKNSFKAFGKSLQAFGRTLSKCGFVGVTVIASVVVGNYLRNSLSSRMCSEIKPLLVQENTDCDEKLLSSSVFIYSSYALGFSFVVLLI